MYKFDVDKKVARNRDYDRHTFSPEKENVRDKGGEKCGPNSTERKFKVNDVIDLSDQYR